MPSPLPFGSFAELLKDHRTNMGWTQREMARQWGYSIDTISAWERGKRIPGIQQIPRLAEFLKLHADEVAQLINFRHRAESGQKARGTKAQTSIESEIFTVYPNQRACEDEIRESSLHAKNIKILTIRGNKYFQGQMSILSHLCSLDMTKEQIVRVLVLSPESDHITEELAERLKHPSSEEIRVGMRFVFDYLKYIASRKVHFQLKYYTQSPNFKILLFDDIMFVSAFITAKNDDFVRMIKMMRENNPLFAGFENYFDLLWDNSSIL
jgi:transcriptional regulator with XRE-family HTH domain